MANNDLISREALKDKLTDTINPNDIAKNEWYEGYAACVQVLSDLINNAPTVPLPDFKEGYKQAILDGKTNFSRPRGRWEIRMIYYCPECGHYCGESGGDFCPHCGADMRGDAE